MLQISFGDLRLGFTQALLAKPPAKFKIKISIHAAPAFFDMVVSNWLQIYCKFINL